MDQDSMRLPLPALRTAGRRPFSLLEGCVPSPRVLLLLPAYALLLGAAELLTAAVQAAFPALGAACYGAVVLLLGGHAALCWEQPRRYVPLVAAAAPVARLLLLLAPGGGAPLSRGLALGLPLLLAAVVALPLAGLGPDQVTAWLLRVAAWARRVRKAARGHSFWPGWHSPDSEHAPAGLARSWMVSLRRRAPILSRRALLLPAATLCLALFASVWVAHAAGPRQALPEVGAAQASGQDETLLYARPHPLASWSAPRTGEKQAPAEPARRGLLTRRTAARATAYGGRTLPELADDDASALTAAAAPAPAKVPAAVLYPNCPSLGLWNPYPRGVCTWYAKDRRPDLPGFIDDWGLAINWPRAAELCGFRVDGVPRAGAVIAFGPGANGAYWGGHVGYVEEVQPGALLISECNADQDSAFAVSPHWWEAGYSCTFRRIPWEVLSSDVVYIHGYQEPAGPPTRWSPTPRDGVNEAAGAARESTP